MASITLNDLDLSEDLDREAMRSLRGAAGEGNWVLGAFPAYVTPVPTDAQVFNMFQQVTNNYCAFRPRRTADPVMTDSIGAKRRKPVD